MYICPSVKNYDTGYLLTRKQIRENSVHCGAGGAGGGVRVEGRVGWGVGGVQ